jgi:hypothetical protein
MQSLFSLVLRLRLLEMQAGWKLHVIHVAGTRTIRQGSDGLSRGDLLTGVMAGQSMLSFVPLHLSATERFPLLGGILVARLLARMADPRRLV